MKKRRRAEKDAVEAIVNEGPSFTDPQGSCTGTYDDEEDMQPVQDADDL